MSECMLVNREDMMELTRRMTLSRNSLFRIAGCYIDDDGDYEGSFNTSFLKLSSKDKIKNLELMKKVPFSETNINLKRYLFDSKKPETSQMWRLLMTLKECKLKNDEMLDLFYDFIMERFKCAGAYGIRIAYGCYDVPIKTKNHESQRESEEVYEYLICTIAPTLDDYEAGDPLCGFLFPAFTDRGGDRNHICVFQSNAKRPHSEWEELLGV
ncbi:MAG: DUF4317 family protein [Eubacteriales bacterium]|nr:DUF4317 family protein [Eubacteriales bacterium]